jgi:hypothetical protein
MKQSIDGKPQQAEPNSHCRGLPTADTAGSKLEVALVRSRWWRYYRCSHQSGVTIRRWLEWGATPPWVNNAPANGIAGNHRQGRLLRVRALLDLKRALGRD